MTGIEVRSDGGDFAELWVNGVRVLDLNSDADDLTTADEVAQAIGDALGIPVIIDNDYDWNQDSDCLERRSE